MVVLYATGSFLIYLQNAAINGSE